VLTGRVSARGAVRRGAAGLCIGAVLLLAACSSSDGTSDSAEAAGAVSPTTTRAETTAPVLDDRGLRFKEALSAEGLVADVPDETLLALARGLCDQLAAGVPEERVLELARPVAAYAASASDTTGDDAAHSYVNAAREHYC